jgi:hypothetical protein
VEPGSTYPSKLVDDVSAFLRGPCVSASGGGELLLSPSGTAGGIGARFVDTQAGASRSTVGVVRVGTGGTIDLSLVGAASTEVVVDVLGFWVPGAGPVMVANTSAQALLISNQSVAAGETVGIRVAGYGGVPSSGVSAVVLAVTANTSKSSLEGFAAIWSAGQGSAPYTGS